MGNVVNKGLKLIILPDDDMIQVIEQNIGNARLSGTSYLACIITYILYLIFMDARYIPIYVILMLC